MTLALNEYRLDETGGSHDTIAKDIIVEISCFGVAISTIVMFDLVMEYLVAQPTTSSVND